MYVSTGQVPVQTLQKQIKEKPERSRPIKPIPTDRISPPNQLRILRAWAAASANGTRPATVNEVSKMVEMAASTVAMANPFFSSIGLLQRLDVGTYAPSEAVLGFLAASQWNPDNAARKLDPAFRQAWFGQLLIPRITYAAIDEETALEELAKASSAGSEYRKALGFLLDLMAASGVIERTEGQIRLSAAGVPNNNGTMTAAFDHNTNDARFHISLRVDSKDLANWNSVQITAFFRGLNELLAIKRDNAA